MIPASIAKRTYILTTMLFTILMAVFVWYSAETAKEEIYRKKEQELLLLASYLEMQMPANIENMLLNEKVQKLPQQEKISLLNLELQSVLEKVGGQYPDYGMGYGVNNERIAVYPLRDGIITQPFAEDGLAAIERAYRTKKAQTFLNSKSTLGVQPTLNVLYPHIINDEVIWFTWVNAKVEYLMMKLFCVVGRSFMVFLLLWLGAVSILRYAFRELQDSLNRLVQQVSASDDQLEILAGFPEFDSLLNAVISMKRGLEDERAITNRRNRELVQMNRKMAWQAKLWELAQNAIIVKDVAHVIVYWNSSAASFYGWTKDEAVGAVAHDLLNTVFPEPLEFIMSTVCETGHWSGELIQTKRSGEQVVVKSNWILCKDEHGEIASYIEINMDITSQKKAEWQREEALERFRKAFHSNPLMMSITSIKNWQIVDANQIFLATIGRTREEVIGKTPEQFGFWKDISKINAIRKKINSGNGKFQNIEVEIVAKNNEVRTVLFSTESLWIGDESCSLGMFNDITEIKSYEQEIARLDRLNIVGEMAAGIGHEVRNPLTTVRGYLQLFQRKKKYAEDQEQLGIMIEELDRANSIITEFLSLAKNKQAELKPGILNNSIQAIFPLLQADALRQGHEIKTDIGDIPVICFDDQEIRQIILNLVRNAFEAMRPGGLVIIKTYADHDEVVLAVTDTGDGIPDIILKKLGTPFITTKEAGTGLGLPVCYRIAERHGAKIDVDTSPAGTTFFVKFKRLQGGHPNHSE